MPDGSLHRGQFRLARIQLVNWGTLEGAHDLTVPRDGLLITGESGSGKSTLLDALSAVLVAPGDLDLNAAAHDQASAGGDRSLVTYVRGAYSREEDEAGDVVTRTLRPGATWSGIVLTFDDLDERVTLVKLMHLGRGGSTTADLSQAHVLQSGDVELSDLERFVMNGLDMKGLRSYVSDGYVAQAYTEFASRFRRRLGLVGDNAQVLLHKTQSAKNMASLDALLRDFMLDEPATFALADEAVEQFADLSRAHREVTTATSQVEHLLPLRDVAARYDAAEESLASLTAQQDQLDLYTTGLKAQLAEADITEQTRRLEVLSARLQEARSDLEASRTALAGAQSRFEGAGGGAIEVAATRLDLARRRLEVARAAEQVFTRQLAQLDSDTPHDAAEFAAFRSSVLTELETMDESMADQVTQRAQAQVPVVLAGQEVESLRQRLSRIQRTGLNVEPELVEARTRLSRAVNLPSTALPFVAELVGVRADASDWAGPAERALAFFARTILVDADDYRRVALAAERIALGATVRMRRVPREVSAIPRRTLSDSLVRKLEVQPGRFADFLAVVLSREFDLASVPTGADFVLHPRAVAQSGQVRMDDLHVASDRFLVEDPSRWVLRGSRERCVDALIGRLRQAEQRLRSVRNDADRVERYFVELLERRQILTAVTRVAWDDVDVERRRAEVSHLEDELDLIRRIEQSAVRAQAALAHARARTRESEDHVARIAAEHAAAENRVARLREQLPAHRAEIGDRTVADDVAAALDEEFRNIARSRSLATVDAQHAKVLRSLSDRARETLTRRDDAARVVERTITGYLERWPDAAALLRADSAYRADAVALLDALQAETLPALEKRFLALLQEQSQVNMGRLAGELAAAPAQVRDRIEPVNESLAAVPFSESPQGKQRHLRIRVEEHPSILVREMLTQLREISETSGASDTARISGAQEREKAEQRFLLLKKLLDRLGSHEPADLSWRRQVLDTRLHVRFTGLEVDEKGRVTNVYESGVGLSGGQRQKLVTFCLAAALRYQLTATGGVEPGYGTVVLDEAFDKADQRFTRIAMGVFQTFGFHLILATPMKLLQTVEDYIGGVCLVTIADEKHTELAATNFV